MRQRYLQFIPFSQNQSQMNQQHQQQDQNSNPMNQQNDAPIDPSMDFEFALNMAEIASYCSITGKYINLSILT